MEIKGLKRINNVTFKDALLMLYRYLTNPSLKYVWFTMSYKDGRVCKADSLEEILNNWNKIDWINSTGFEVCLSSTIADSNFNRVNIKYNFPEDGSLTTGTIIKVRS